VLTNGLAKSGNAQISGVKTAKISFEFLTNKNKINETIFID